MKILVLTPISPILNQHPYAAVTRQFANNKDVLVLSYPFLADIRAKMQQQQYIPHLFAMMKAMALNEELQEKVMDRKHTIVIGNSMRDERFDYIVAYESSAMDSLHFDSYIESLKGDEEVRAALNIDDLYSLEQAEITLPTIEHLKLFLEGVIKND